MEGNFGGGQICRKTHIGRIKFGKPSIFRLKKIIQQNFSIIFERNRYETLHVNAIASLMGLSYVAIALRQLRT